jgi:hypothetical protein
MRYRLREGLHFCLSDGRAIFFDVPGDRYFRLQPKCEQDFLGLLAGSDASPDLSALERAQLLIATRDVAPPLAPASVLQPTRELPECSTPMISRSGISCILAQIGAVMSLRLNSFEKTIAQLRSPGKSTCRPSIEDLARLRADFEATAPLRPRSRHCLSNSLAFFYVARRRGWSVQLVMGVSAQPFAAHCWVQMDETLLNDRLENVRPFQPIFSVAC